MAYRPPRLFPMLLLGCVALLVLSRLQPGSVQPPLPEPSSPSSQQVTNRFGLEPRLARVKRVVDGDTLLLEDGERIRLFGVDTPETKIPNQPPEPFGLEATEFTTQFVAGQTIRLEFDAERYDKYGRTLAYVYVGNRMLNEELILAGLSPAQLQYPFRNDMKRRFAAAEQVARSRGVGLWSVPTPGNGPVTSPHRQRELRQNLPERTPQGMQPNL